MNEVHQQTIDAMIGNAVGTGGDNDDEHQGAITRNGGARFGKETLGK